MLRRIASICATIALAANAVGHVAGIAVGWHPGFKEASSFLVAGIAALLVTEAHLLQRGRNEPPDQPGSIHQQRRRPFGLIPPLWFVPIVAMFFYAAFLRRRLPDPAAAVRIMTAVGAAASLLSLAFLRAPLPSRDSTG
jgi:ribose/xylose/arabinose/galactoside ABC-type transport system permease subunit